MNYFLSFENIVIKIMRLTKPFYIYDFPYLYKRFLYQNFLINISLPKFKYLFNDFKVFLKEKS